MISCSAPERSGVALAITPTLETKMKLKTFRVHYTIVTQEGDTRESAEVSATSPEAARTTLRKTLRKELADDVRLDIRKTHLIRK